MLLFQHIKWYLYVHFNQQCFDITITSIINIKNSNYCEENMFIAERIVCFCSHSSVGINDLV